MFNTISETPINMRDKFRKTRHNNLFRQQHLTLSTEVHHIRPRSSEANWKSRELSRNPLYTPGRKINRVQTQPRICTNRHRFGFKITHSIHKHLREQKTTSTKEEIIRRTAAQVSQKPQFTNRNLRRTAAQVSQRSSPWNSFCLIAATPCAAAGG